MSQESEPVFQLHDDDPWDISEKAFTIITSHLKDPKRSSAVELDALNPLKRPTIDGKANESPVSFLLEFWSVVLDIAKQIPQDHQYQDDLVQLLLDLSQQSFQKVEIWGRQQDMMGSLPLLREAIAEAAQGMPNNDIPNTSSHSDLTLV